MSFIGKKFLAALAATAVLIGIVYLKRPKPDAPLSKPSPDTNAVAAKVKPPKVHRRSRSAAAVATTNETERDVVPLAEQERMKRMADNLLKPPLTLGPAAAARMREDWVQRYRKETDPLLREEIITEMAQLDDPETIKIMKELLAGESDSGARQQIILMLGYMRATGAEIATVSAAMMSDYQQCNNAEERGRILEVISNFPRAEAVKTMQTAFFANDASAEDRFHAAEGLFKLSPRVAVDPEVLRQVTEKLKWDAKFAATEQERLMCDRALAAPGQDNKTFFNELLNTEKSPDVRKFLALAAEQYPTH